MMSGGELEDLSQEELLGLMRDLEGQTFEFHSRGRVLPLTTDEFDMAPLLGCIDEFVGFVSGNGTPVSDFSKIQFRKGASAVLFRLFQLLPVVLSIFDERLKYSLKINLFFEMVKELGWPSLLSKQAKDRVTEKHTLGEYFNALIVGIHQKANARAFKERSRLENFGLRREFKKAKKYVDALFAKHSRLLVVRVDLRYRTDLVEAQPDMLERFQMDLRAFKRGMRRSSRHDVFEGLVGYLQAHEYGIKIRHHAHFILFFNGHIRHKVKHGYIAMEIGKHWAKITNNDGAFFSSNLDKKFQENPNYVLGEIRRVDSEKRTILNGKVVAYLFKRSQLLHYRLSPKMKTIVRGLWP